MTRSRLLLIAAVIVLVVGLYLTFQLDSGPDTTTVAAAVTTLAAPSTTSSTTTTTAAATTSPPPPGTTNPSPPLFQSSMATVTAEDLHASWRPGCPLAVDALVAVEVSHFGFDGEVGTGTLVVSAEVAEEIVDIMSRLFEARFPIERMEPVDIYDGDDDLSMSANNTSAFNCRAVTGGSSWSDHAYGTAIDVNPLVNPYVRRDTVLPPEGAPYVDRTLDAPGMIHEGDVVVVAFAEHGWVWGGSWSFPKDYQHFTRPGR